MYWLWFLFVFYFLILMIVVLEWHIGRIKNVLTRNRVISAYNNLKAFAMSNFTINEPNEPMGYVCGIMLNYLANQIKSLHIYDYPCTADTSIQTWFPKNVEHLCLHSKLILLFDDDPMFLNTSHLWHQINSNMFPKLKHLKISNIMDAKNRRQLHMVNSNIYNRNFSDNKVDIIKNIGSLVRSNLESLHVHLSELLRKDIVGIENDDNEHTSNLNSNSHSNTTSTDVNSNEKKTAMNSNTCNDEFKI